MTRQWLADPHKMCTKHLMGEHAETHGFMEKMTAGINLEGFIVGSLFFGAEYVRARHDLLAPLIKGHGSPLTISADIIEKYPLIVPTEKDVLESVTTLFSRCQECAKLHLYSQNKVK